LAPSRAIAIVEFLEPTEAKVAFKALAYSKFHNVPLYLEWTPIAVFLGPPKTTPGLFVNLMHLHPQNAIISILGSNLLICFVFLLKFSDSSSSTQTTTTTTTTPVPEEELSLIDEEAEHVETSTLYIKNLSFDTTEEGLKKLFPKARSILIAKKKIMGMKGVEKSLGYGFIEFHSKQEAVEAIKQHNGALVDGHAIHLQFSKSKQEASENKRKAISEKPPSKKLAIRNVPFQTTKKELRNLFK
jgi:multiple RNA-binding domain-containing protein 1